MLPKQRSYDIPTHYYRGFTATVLTVLFTPVAHSFWAVFGFLVWSPDVPENKCSLFAHSRSHIRLPD